VKILALADSVSPYVYDHFKPEHFQDIDLVLCAGDLPIDYMSFVATVIHKPVLYIHGNHDRKHLENPPGGCTCIEDRIVTVNGLRIMGLGGSMYYSGGPHQFTEKQMQQRIKRQWLPLLQGVDILLTHAPIFGIGDGLDLPHRGFESFAHFVVKYKPKYVVHGHQHLNYGQQPREHQLNETRIVNAYGYVMLEV